MARGPAEAPIIAVSAPVSTAMPTTASGNSSAPAPARGYPAPSMSRIQVLTFTRQQQKPPPAHATAQALAARRPIDEIFLQAAGDSPCRPESWAVSRSASNPPAAGARAVARPAPRADIPAGVLR